MYLLYQVSNFTNATGKHLQKYTGKISEIKTEFAELQQRVMKIKKRPEVQIAMRQRPHVCSMFEKRKGQIRYEIFL